MAEKVQHIADYERLHGPGSASWCGVDPTPSEPKHGKGRDCARTEEVLESYRRRAIRAELELTRLRAHIDGLEGGEPVVQ